MDASSARWHRVTPSTFPWEDEAIDFLRGRLPDADPIRAWSNFEFISGGSISEVDVFLLTRKGAFLIEIKSVPGRVRGDQQQWVFHKPDGGIRTMENPLLSANRKAKRLKSLLANQWRRVAGSGASPEPPFIQPLVFLSDPDLDVQLHDDARTHVHGRDGSRVVTEWRSLGGIANAVMTLGRAEVENPRFRQLNTPTSSAVAAALDHIGIKESNRRRRVGSWILRLDTVSERPGIQDFVADHESMPGIERRIRIYSRVPHMSDEQATSLRQAADREFRAGERLTHQQVVRAYERFDTDLGSALVFPYDAGAVRLDRWVAGGDLSIDVRLAVLRQLAETLQAVHRQRITHRSLSPGSVLVRPGADDAPPQVLVADFSLAGRDGHGTTTAASRYGLLSAAPGEVELLADDSALLYQSPERLTDAEPDGVALDMFSFGALAYLVLAGQPPGDSPAAVRESLLAGRGLQLAAVAPGVSASLHELVVEATRPVVSDRLATFDEVAVFLDCAEEELTAPKVSVEPAVTEIDPLDARPNDRLGDGAIVKRRLGRGSTALALLVDRGGDERPSEVVYKVSVGGDADGRLREESRILAELQHPAIVRRFEERELAGRPVLVEALAGSQSLADELRTNGTPGIEFLERWGSDLLDAVRYLEREGRSHRDIKPDNLGVTEVGPQRRQHLVLFDFSLASAPATDVRAGTTPYLDPFLVERGRWDLAAERYAASVTLYEMATGETPQWGDGQTDPAFTTGEATIDAVLFDPAARDGLESFFERAMRRDVGQRFGDAAEMLRAWQRVFEGVQPVAPDVEDPVEPGSTQILPATIGLDDPVVSLHSSGQVLSALNRLQVTSVRGVAALAPMTVNRARRISPRVRRRIIELRAAVLARFGDELAAEIAATSPAEAAGAATAASRPANSMAIERLDLDLLVPLLVREHRAGPQGSTQHAARLLLGLDELPDTQDDWPTQTAVADAVGVTRARLGQVAAMLRDHWAALAPLQSVRDDLVDAVVGAGGVVAVGELTPHVVAARGSGLPVAAARVAARAVVRAAVEAEQVDGRRLVVRRRGERVLVAAELDDAASELHFDGAALAGYAADLGDRADVLVGATGDVVPQDRALPALRAVRAPDGTALADGRLLRLAGAASQRTAVSTALELYPTSLDPARALRLARQALTSEGRLDVAAVRERVAARFPAVRLPDRPELDAALALAEVLVRWDDGQQAYLPPDTSVGDLTTMTSFVQRASTRAARPRPVAAVVDPDVVAAQEIEGRLDRSWRAGGLLVLRAPSTRGAELRVGLRRFEQPPFGFVGLDLDRCFLDELRAAAAAKRIEWSKLVAADLAAPGTTDHTNLRILTHEAATAVDRRVRSAGSHVIAWNPGLLARYGELAVVDQWRDLAGRADAALHTLWLVVFGTTAEPRPTIDGHVVPLLGPSGWIDVTDGWLANVHRAQLPGDAELTG